MVTAYVTVYRTKDGKFRCGEYVHSKENCAYLSIPILEGETCMGVFPIEIDPKARAKSGMNTRLDWVQKHPDWAADPDSAP